MPVFTFSVLIKKILYEIYDPGIEPTCLCLLHWQTGALLLLLLLLLSRFSRVQLCATP